MTISASIQLRVTKATQQWQKQKSSLNRYFLLYFLLRSLTSNNRGLILAPYLFSSENSASHPIRISFKFMPRPHSRCCQPSSGQRGRCSTSNIKNDRMHGFDAVSFRTIRTDINWPFSHSECYIAATHDKKVECGGGGHPKSTLIRAKRSL